MNTGIPQPDNALTMRAGAAEFVARAQAACEILTEASDDEGSDIVSAAVVEALNSLIDLAPHFPAGHVDKVLVGFLQDSILNRRVRNLQDFVKTIVAARPARLDTAHMMALLCGRATPVAPAEWQPGSERAFPTIVNIQGARLAADQHHGMLPLLHRLLIDFRRPDFDADATPEGRWALPADYRVYVGIKEFLEPVLNSKGLSDAEKATIWISPHGAEQLTLAQVAMRKDHVGAAAGIVEALMSSKVEWPLMWDLIDLQKVDLRNVADGLQQLAALPLHEWTGEVLEWMEPLAGWQALLRQEGRATVGEPGSGLDRQCTSTDLRAVGMLATLKFYCWSISAIPGLCEYKLETPPEGAESKGETAQWYAVPWDLVQPRALP